MRERTTILLIVLLAIVPSNGQESSSTGSPLASTTTNVLTPPPDWFLSSSTSDTPLDTQIRDLQDAAVVEQRKQLEADRQAELPLALEDGDVPTSTPWESSTSPMPAPFEVTASSSTGDSLHPPVADLERSTLDDATEWSSTGVPGAELNTKQPRQADEQLPDPNQLADPSLEPMHLARPDYRPLEEGVPGAVPLPPPPMEAPAAETVMSMGDEETTTTSTTTPEPPPEEAETPANGEAETKPEETETTTETVATEAAQSETTTAQTAENAQEAGSRVADAVPETDTGNDETALNAEAVEALTKALDDADVLVQNITIVLPGDSPSLHAFLGALLANRPAYLTSNPGTQLEQQRQAVQRMPTPLPVVPLPFVPMRVPPPASAFFNPSQQTQQAPLSQNYGRQWHPKQPISALPFVPSSAYNNPQTAATSTAQQKPRPPSFLVEVEQLHSWIKTGQRVKILDASYEPEAGVTDHIRFYSDYYGKWDKLMKEKKSRQYVRSHIPEAIPFNLNVATYPSWNERQALYPPERFEQYVQRLGIDAGDRLVIYARGPLGGMLHAARAWFLFRIYGHNNVTVLNGGLDAWRHADLPATDAAVETGMGNWKAKFNPELIVTFEELTNADTDGYCVLSRLFWYNFLDARPRSEFFGVSGPQLMGPQRTRVAGAKPFPADELVQDGILVPPGEIFRRLQQIGYSRTYPTIVMGNTADEASLALLALAQVQDTRARLYNGGMEEIRRRAPYLITAKRRRRK